MFMMKIVASLLGFALSVSRAHVLATRMSADHYNTSTGDTIRTSGCTINATNMHVNFEVDDLGRRWVTFVDEYGEEETSCRIEK